MSDHDKPTRYSETDPVLALGRLKGHDKLTDEQCQVTNTDRELWREREGDYYADSIHVTTSGGIGINCGGTVIVKSLRQWHNDDAELRALRKSESQIVDLGDSCCVEGCEGEKFYRKIAQLEAENAALRQLRDEVEPVLREAYHKVDCLHAEGVINDILARYYGEKHD